MELERRFSAYEWEQLTEADVKQLMINDMAIEIASKLFKHADTAVFHNIESNEFTVKVMVNMPEPGPSALDRMIGSVPLFKEIGEEDQTDFFIEGHNGERVNVTELVNALKERKR